MEAVTQREGTASSLGASFGVGEFFGLRFAVAVLIFIGAAVLFWTEPSIRTAAFHTILDSCIFLTSAMLALTLWDVGRRGDDPMIGALAIIFTVVSCVELYHTMTAVVSTALNTQYDPALVSRLTGSWGPSSYVLPIALVAVVLVPQLQSRGWLLTAALIACSGLLLVLFDLWPRFTAPGFLGMTRPNLALTPVFWLAAMILFARRGRTSMDWAIAVAGVLSVPTFAIICYSTSPYDAPALISHSGKLVARAFLLFSAVQMSARDVTRRIFAEEALRALTQNLELRVSERTASLTREMDSRKEAEQRAYVQLARLNLLHEISSAIGQRLDLESIFQTTVRQIETQFSAQLVLIARYTPGDDFVAVSNVGKASLPTTRELDMGPGAHIEVMPGALRKLSAGELIYEPNLPSWPGPFAQRLARAGLRSALLAPLSFDGRLVALLMVARSEAEAFSSSDCEFLIKLAVHVALAARQAELHGDLQRAYDNLQQSQDAMLQQERLSALGQMASGIAHDINNAISPLSLTTQAIMRNEPDLSRRMRDYLDTVKRVTDDVAATVARMREFYRQRDDKPLDAVDLNELAQQTIDLTRARWSSMPLERGIEVDLRAAYDPSLPPAAGSASDIREALTNLVFNAVDAMPKGGGIVVRTGMLADHGASVPRIFVEVSDSGIGMDEQTRQRCLEPFFTTKGERGTGLGLAMVFGAMQRMGGAIEIDSVPGEGTTVRLVFRQAAVQSAPSPAETRRPAASMKVLIVDDDPFILDSMQIVLELDGHQVTTADGGAVALALLGAEAAAGTPFDAVFTDLGMPGMDGRALAKEIKARSPATPVVLLTGWGKHVGEQSIGQGVDIALSKPPSQEALQDALAQCAALRAATA